ncbi:amino acid adenylation domain-containing protein [Paenibacillus sp. cl6col]|uniref:Non-ribosomal peptide synthetase n=1 Tax=Paenibacillus alvei TaxID=44250 RepID=A0ABT4E948_PAEAL|nr:MULTISPECIES: non-ribosomal peptide synthetase [Paenibacillus]EPY11369.1 amino acid adenylation domain-containing protein [Paenibacillus alvei A6-6i-x]MCY9530252.1 non-ribosomal peptide synthetase [Paenibacillus alvei]SDF67342.1 amino acid adenylation domain-containing protein [Paenibacillus sp. cl6col]
MLGDNAKKIDKSNVEDIVALSPIQKGLLYHYLKHGELDYYFEHLDLTLTGQLCLSSIRRAWNFVAETNELLRTVFRWENLDHPLQIILKQHTIPVTIHDFSVLTEEEREKLVQNVREQERNVRLNLEVEPIRVTVCKLTNNTSEMIVRWHHILFDGWSNAIILKELLDAYNSYYLGNHPKQTNKTKYKEFIKWHQRQNRSKQETFWSNFLCHFEESSSLPYDWSGEPSGVVDRFISELSLSDTSLAVEFARQQQLTISSLLYSVWALMLIKYNSQCDIVFGTTVSGRVPSIEAIEEMVGLFINTVPLRIKSDFGMQAHDFIRYVDETLRIREEFEQTPLVEIEKYCNHEGIAPLFNSIVVIENYPVDSKLRQAGFLNIESYQMYETTNYPLTLGINLKEKLELEFIYDTSLFTREFVERMYGHFQNILLQVINKPEIRLSEIEIVTATEKNQILYAFNKDLHLPDNGEVVHQAFEKQADRTPDATAIIYKGIKYSYREINEKANALARMLRQKGVHEESFVPILMERSQTLIISMLGVLKAGGSYIPIDSEYTSDRISRILADCEANILVTKQKFMKDMHFSGHTVFVEDDFGEADATNPSNLNCSSHLVYMIYTSGSTGIPKGVMIEHRNLLAYVRAFQQEFSLSTEDVILQQASCSFDVFVEEVYPALLNGGTVLIADKEDILDLKKLENLLHTHQVSIVSCSPLLLNELNRRANFVFIHTFISGGDVLKPNYISNLIGHSKVYNTYGPTETTVCATYYRCNRTDDNSIPIGGPVLGYNVYILNQENQILPIGIPGEICIAGAGVGRGYRNNPNLSAEKFISDPFNSRLRMYRTGDFGKWLPDGSIHFMGRKDEQVKIRGFRIELGEIAHHLSSYESIEDAVVLIVNDHTGNKSISAYLKSKVQLTVSEIKDYLAGKLPYYMIPSHFYKIDAVPLTSNAKIDKSALIKCGRSLHAGEESSDTPDEIESLIRRVWVDILQLENVGLHDHFFDIGGNSILLMQLHAKLEKEYSWGVSIPDLFIYSTISKLAKYVATKKQELSEEVFLNYEKLPSNFFQHNTNANGEGTIKFYLKNQRFKTLKQVATVNNIELLDVLLSMYVFLFSQINKQKTVTLQFTRANGYAVPLLIDLSQFQEFPRLFQYISEKRNDDFYNQTYHLDQAYTIRRNKGFDEILPLVSIGDELAINSKLLEIFDLVLILEEHYEDEQFLFVCKFNNRRLGTQQISSLINGYLDVVGQLADNHVFS